MLALPLQTLDVSSKTLFIFNCIYFKPSSGSITPPPPSSPPILLHLCLRPQIRDRHRWCDPRRAFHTSTPACLVNISTFLSRRASSPPLSHPPLSDKPPEGEPGTVKLSFMASLLWMCNLCFGSLLLQLIVFFHKMFFFFFFWSSAQFGFGLTAACREVIQTHLALPYFEMKLAGISTPHLQTYRHSESHKVNIIVKIKNWDWKINSRCVFSHPSKVMILHTKVWIDEKLRNKCDSSFYL